MVNERETLYYHQNPSPSMVGKEQIHLLPVFHHCPTWHIFNFHVRETNPYLIPYDENDVPYEYYGGQLVRIASRKRIQTFKVKANV